MSTVRSLLPALGASLLCAAGAPGEKVAFGPSAGTTLTKTFTTAGEYSLDDLSLTVDGQDIGQMLGSIEVSLKQGSTIEVTDAYKAFGEGRPTELLRTFDELGAKMNMEISPAQGEVPQFESTSPLEGKTVLFKWNAEKDEYERSFHEGEGDAELLDGLKEDMDLRIFLPSKEVSAGDSWSVALTELQSVVMPGGDLHLEPEGQEVNEDAKKMFEGIFEDFGKKLGDLLEGECKCTFKGTQGEGDARVAEIAIEVKVATTLDLAEVLDKAIRAVLEQQDVGAKVDLSLETADLNFDFDGSGTLLWNLSAGRLQSFQLGGDITVDMDLALTVDAEGEHHKLDASFEMSGTLHEEVATKE